MATDAQIAEWLRKHKKTARLQLYNQATSTMVYEWLMEDAPDNLVEFASVISQTAQEECNRGQVGDQMYQLKARAEGGKVTGNLVLEVCIDPAYAFQLAAGQHGGLIGIALTQVLTHKNKDQQQQHHATQAALKMVMDTNALLVADRKQTNQLLFDLLGKIFDLRMTALQADNDDTVIQEAWAVQLDKVTDGLLTEAIPRIGTLIDEGTKRLLAEGPKNKGGRPKKKTNGKTNDKTRNGARKK